MNAPPKKWNLKKWKYVSLCFFLIYLIISFYICSGHVSGKVSRKTCRTFMKMEVVWSGHKGRIDLERWMVLWCFVIFCVFFSQVLSFYSLHISFFSPVISRDQCPQREQQTFPQDWEYYAILWSILWRYVCHTCLSFFQLFWSFRKSLSWVISVCHSLFICSEVSGRVFGKVVVHSFYCSKNLLYVFQCFL